MLWYNTNKEKDLYDEKIRTKMLKDLRSDWIVARKPTASILQLTIFDGI